MLKVAGFKATSSSVQMKENAEEKSLYKLVSFQSVTGNECHKKRFSITLCNLPCDITFERFQTELDLFAENYLKENLECYKIIHFFEGNPR